MTERFKHSELNNRKIRQSLCLAGVSDFVASQYNEGRERDIRAYLEERNTVAYAAGQFAKAALRGDPVASEWCRNNEIKITKAQATNLNIAGGVLVPQIVADEVAMLAERFGVARRYTGVGLMTSDSETFPRAVTGFTAGYIQENASGTFSQPNYDGVGLYTKKLAAFSKISSELFEDASDKLGRFLIAGLALAFAKVEDDTTFNADGTSAYAGMRGVTTLLGDGGHSASKITAASGHNTFGTLDASDIGNAIAALPARAMLKPKLFISITGYGASLARLGQTAGLVTSIAPDGSLQANYAGLEVVFCQSLPIATTNQTGKCLLCVGDLSQAVTFGLRRDLAISVAAETYADTDQVLIKAIERLDIVAGDMGDNSTAGPVIGLFAP